MSASGLSISRVSVVCSFLQDLPAHRGTCPPRYWGRRHMANLWTSGPAVSRRDKHTHHTHMVFPRRLHTEKHKCDNRFSVSLCVFCVGLRGDPLHPAGGLPSFLGRGPAQAVPADQGRGLWCESALHSSHFSPPAVKALPSPSIALVPFWQLLRNSVTSFIFKGVQEREPHLRSHWTPCQIERERGGLTLWQWFTGRDLGVYA